MLTSLNSSPLLVTCVPSMVFLECSTPQTIICYFSIVSGVWSLSLYCVPLLGIVPVLFLIKVNFLFGALHHSCSFVLTLCCIQPEVREPEESLQPPSLEHSSPESHHRHLIVHNPETLQLHGVTPPALHFQEAPAFPKCYHPPCSCWDHQFIFQKSFITMSKQSKKILA